MDYSFIIPVKDQWLLTRDMLLSLMAHTRQYLRRAEVLIVDDGSGEETESMLDRLKEPCRVIRNGENLGYAASNNRAAYEAKGDMLVLLNNDLLLTRGWFEPLLAAHRTEKNLGLVGNVHINAFTGAVDHMGKFMDPEGLPRHYGQMYEDLFPCEPDIGFMEFPSVTAACWMIPRRAFVDMDGFDCQYRNGFEDDDFCQRLRQGGLRAGVAFRSRIYHYVSRSEGRKTHEDANRDRYLSFWKETGIQWHRERFDEQITLMKNWKRQP